MHTEFWHNLSQIAIFSYSTHEILSIYSIYLYYELTNCKVVSYSCIALLVILCRFCSQNIVQVKHHHTNSYTGSGIHILYNVLVIPCCAAQCWPMVLSGLDMVGIAQTGSGKTLAVSSNACIPVTVSI